MSDCLFCKIIAGDIPTEKIYEDAFQLGKIYPPLTNHLHYDQDRYYQTIDCPL
jgi:diadenosine tetraphosphate (Ap4A) HIT family hydrolase